MESFQKRERDRRKRAKQQEKTDRKAQRTAEKAQGAEGAAYNSDIVDDSPEAERARAPNLPPTS
jgi:hypothetical protein